MTNTSPITRYRKDNGRMTLEQFGKLFKPAVDKSTVLRWERGNVTPARAVEIERVIGIPRAALCPAVFSPAPKPRRRNAEASA